MLKFVGKSHKKALGDMLRFLDSEKDRVYMLCGEPGIGKSRVLNEFMESEIFRGNRFAKKFIIYRDESIEPLLIDWLKKLLSSISLFEGNKERWKKMVEAIPEFGKGLSLFIKDDNRPAKQKFLEGLHLLSDKMKADERLVIVIDPFVDLKTHENADVLLHFANESPEKIKFVIAQRTSDLLANDSNFIRLVGNNVATLDRLEDAEVEEILCSDEQLRRIGTEKRLEFANKVGGWPLALDSYSQKIEQSNESPETVIDSLPKDLEKEVKNNYKELDSKGRKVAELLSLLGVNIDFQTLAKLSELDASELSTVLDSKTLNRLIESESAKGEPQKFGMHHALYAQWIVDLLRGRIDMPARYKEIAVFFKKRFDEDNLRSQDLVHYVTYLFAVGDEELFLKETYGIGPKMLDFALYDSVLDLEQKKLAIAQNLGEREIESDALHNISRVNNAWGRNDEALKSLKQSLDIRREIGDRSGEGAALNNISQVYHSQYKYSEALKYIQQSLEISREIRDHSGVGANLNNIGQLHHSWGKYNEALKYFRLSLEIHRKIRSRNGEATTLNNIGQLYSEWGKYDEALKYFRLSLEIIREIGDRSGEGVTLNNIGLVYEAWGKYDEALEHLMQSLEVNREIGNPSGERIALNNIGQVYNEWGKYNDALKYFRQSLEISRKIGNRGGEGAALNNISLVYSEWGKHDEALMYLQQSLEISREIGDRNGEAVTRFNIAGYYVIQGNLRLGVEYVEIAVKIFRELKSPNLEMCTEYLNRLKAKLKNGV